LCALAQLLCRSKFPRDTQHAKRVRLLTAADCFSIHLSPAHAPCSSCFAQYARQLRCHFIADASLYSTRTLTPAFFRHAGRLFSIRKRRTKRPASPGKNMKGKYDKKQQSCY
jgi:hypothetical protein